MAKDSSELIFMTSVCPDARVTTEVVDIREPVLIYLLPYGREARLIFQHDYFRGYMSEYNRSAFYI